jgi:hypothetical protein
MSKSKRESSDKIPHVIPHSGYTDDGRRIPTRLEELVENDPVDIQKVEYPAINQKEYNRLRKAKSATKGNRHSH